MSSHYTRIIIFGLLAILWQCEKERRREIRTGRDIVKNKHQAQAIEEEFFIDAQRMIECFTLTHTH